MLFCSFHHTKLFAFAGCSAIHYAANYGSIEIVQLICGRLQNADPLAIDKMTPLCLACARNSPDVGEPKLSKPLLSQDAVQNNFRLPSSLLLSVDNREDERKKHKEILIQLI